MTFELTEKPKGLYSDAVSVFYSTALLGSPVFIYMGFTADTTWNTTNYPLRWAGVIKKVEYNAGVWRVECEGGISLGKAKPLEFDESWGKLQANWAIYTNLTTFKDWHGDFFVPPSEDLLLGAGEFASATTGWTASAGVTSFTAAGGWAKVTGDNDTIHSCTYSNSGAYLALPASAKVGDQFAVTIDYKCDSNLDPAQNFMLGVFGLDASDNVQEQYISSGLLCDSNGGTQRSGSAMITIMDPTTTKIKVVVYFIGTDLLGNYMYFDNIRVFPITNFVNIGRSVYGIYSFTRDTGAVGICRGACGCVSGGDGTNYHVADEDVRRCHVVAGGVGTVLNRILTTTWEGGNGSYDYADGFGMGLPESMVDTAGIAALDTSMPYHHLCFVVDKIVSDPVKWVDDEILRPCGLWMYFNDGKLSVRELPASVSSGTHTLDEAGMVSPGKIALKVGDSDGVVNRVYFYCDHDPSGSMSGLIMNDPDVNKEETPGFTDNTAKREERFLGRFFFNGEDHRTDWALVDQSLASEDDYGVNVYQVKSTGVRSIYSRMYGLPCPGYNYGTPAFTGAGPEVFSYGEYVARHLAQKLIGFYSAPVAVYEYHGFLDRATVEVGDTVSITDSRVPNLGPSGGTFGITNVKGFVIEKDESQDKVTLRCIITDWAVAPSTSQPTYDAPTDPGAGNLTAAFVTSLSAFATGLFTDTPNTTFAGRTLKHNYVVNQTRPASDLAISAVDTGANTVTITGHQLVTGDVVTCSMPGTAPTTSPAGLMATGAQLYVIRVDADTLKFATSRRKAAAGTAIDITNAGSGTRNLLAMRPSKWVETEARMYLGPDLGFCAVGRIRSGAGMWMLGSQGTSDANFADTASAHIYRVYWRFKDGSYSANYYGITA
jgi:hypothetical protein